MQNKHLFAISLLLSNSLVPCLCNAETTTVNQRIPSAISPEASNSSSIDNSSEISKTVWLETVTPMLPAVICKGFMNQKEITAKLDAIKMTHAQCLTAMSESVTKCQEQVNPSIPDKITSADSDIWGKTLGDCIGKDFAMKYLVAK